MLETPSDRRHLGLNFHPESGASMLVWAPFARRLTMKVHGKADVVLEPAEFGYWQAACPQVQPGDRYFLEINGREAWPDPASLLQPEGVHSYSEGIDLAEIRAIREPGWEGIAMEDLIIYELHVGTFTHEGTFRAVAEKLPYLNELGINAIELLPVAAFPGGRNWGYDGVFPFAVQQSYGGPKELARLVKACHAHGIAVILDVVYNHLGPEGNYLEKFGPYFTGKYRTPWGKAINFDDAWCDGVRRYFIENALMWLRDFGFDGLRLDAVHAIKDFSPKHFLQELSEKVRHLSDVTGRDHFLIGECDLNDTRFINPLEQDGYGLHAQWCDEWHHALHALLTGERRGYYADFGGMDQLVKSYNHAYVFDGNYSSHRKKRFGTPTQGQPGQRFVVFTQNHDQVGNRMLGERLSNLLDPGTLKLAAGAMLMSPFVPMLFMGEEYGEENPFLFFISHGDDHLVEQVRKGRKREFRDFFKDARPPDPQAEETFYRSKLSWEVPAGGARENLLGFYKECIRLRKSHSLLRPGPRDHFSARQIPGEDGILLLHSAKDTQLLTIMNFSNRALKAAVPEAEEKECRLLLYSAHEPWGGEVPVEEDPLLKFANGNTIFSMTPRSIAVWMLSKKN
jgi:maltooligosyltrehalose trehalohydrolase